MMHKTFDNCSDRYVRDIFSIFVAKWESTIKTNPALVQSSGAPNNDILQSLYLQRIYMPSRFRRINDKYDLFCRNAGSSSSSSSDAEDWNRIESHYRGRVNSIITSNIYKEENFETALAEKCLDEQTPRIFNSQANIFERAKSILIEGVSRDSVKIDIFLHAMILKSRIITSRCTELLQEFLLEEILSFPASSSHSSILKYPDLDRERSLAVIEKGLNIFDENNLPRTHDARDDDRSSYELMKSYIVESFTNMKVFAIYSAKLGKLDCFSKACNNLIYLATLLWTDLLEPGSQDLSDAESLAEKITKTSNKTEVGKINVALANPEAHIFFGFCEFYDSVKTRHVKPENYLNMGGIPISQALSALRPSCVSPFVEYLVYQKQFKVLSRLMSVIDLLYGSSDRPNDLSKYCTRRLLYSSLLFSYDMHEQDIKSICNDMIKVKLTNATNVESALVKRYSGVTDGKRVLDFLGILEQRHNKAYLRWALDFIKTNEDEEESILRFGAEITDELFTIALRINHFEVAHMILVKSRHNISSNPKYNVNINEMAICVAEGGVDWLCKHGAQVVGTMKDITDKLRSNSLSSFDGYLKQLEYLKTKSERMEVSSSSDGYYLSNCHALFALYISQNRIEDLLTFLGEFLKKIQTKMGEVLATKDDEIPLVILNILGLSLSAAQVVASPKLNELDKAKADNIVLKLRAMLLDCEKRYIELSQPKICHLYPYLELSRSYHFSKYLDHSRFFYHRFNQAKSSFPSHQPSFESFRGLTVRCKDEVIKDDWKDEDQKELQKCIKTLADFARKDKAIDLKVMTAFGPSFCCGMSRSNNQYNNWLILLDALFWADSSDSNWRYHRELLRYICGPSSSSGSSHYLVNTSTVSPILRYLTGCVYIPNRKLRSSLLGQSSKEQKPNGKLHSDLNASIGCLLEHHLILPAAELARFIGSVQMKTLRGLGRLALFSRHPRDTFSHDHPDSHFTSLVTPFSVDKQSLLLTNIESLIKHSVNVPTLDTSTKALKYYESELNSYFKRVCRYKLASGSFGDVFLCDENGKQFVFKHLTKDSDKVNESLILKALNSLKESDTHFPRLICSDENEFQEGICMDFLPHGTLLDRVREATKFSIKDARACMQSLLRGVKIMHDMNIVHRDLKLANIMMASSNKNEFDVKIIDFGFATMVNALEEVECNCGTEAFCAPEIFEKNRSSQKSDVWALGVILYILLKGKLPFPEGKTLEESKQNVKLQFESVDKIDDKVQELLTKMLAKDPASRPDIDGVLADKWFKSQVDDKIDLKTALSQYNEKIEKKNIKFKGMVQQVMQTVSVLNVLRSPQSKNLSEL